MSTPNTHSSTASRPNTPAAQQGPTSSPDGDPRAHVREMLEEFTTVMLVTQEHDPRGSRPHARPMNVAKLGPDCSLWFITDVESPKVDEASMPPMEGQVIAQSKTRFVALRGTFRVVRDTDRIREVWTKANDLWFPDGPTDPRVCLLGFVPFEAELWDTSGTRGLKFLLNAAKALLAGEAIETGNAELHDKVELRNV